MISKNKQKDLYFTFCTLQTYLFMVITTGLRMPHIIASWTPKGRFAHEIDEPSRMLSPSNSRPARASCHALIALDRMVYEPHGSRITDPVHLFHAFHSAVSMHMPINLGMGYSGPPVVRGSRDAASSSSE